MWYVKVKPTLSRAKWYVKRTNLPKMGSSDVIKYRTYLKWCRRCAKNGQATLNWDRWCAKKGEVTTIAVKIFAIFSRAIHFTPSWDTAFTHHLRHFKVGVRGVLNRRPTESGGRWRAKMPNLRTVRVGDVLNVKVGVGGVLNVKPTWSGGRRTNTAFKRLFATI